MKIRTLRTSADCPTDRTCPSIHELDTDPEHRYVIAKRVTDEDVLTAFSSVMAVGEMLGAMPARFVPPGNQLLDRTRGMLDPDREAEHQYVILVAVTDRDVLSLFAGLMAPDEELGRVPVAQLLEV